MLWKSVLVTSLLSLTSFAAPIQRRDTSEIEDNQILKFLNVLEQLKSNFYTQVNATFHDQDFTNAGYSSIAVPKQILSEILADDQSHASFLAEGIEGGALRNCQFKFDTILTDVHAAMSAARVFEQVSVAAYLGAGLLIQDKNLLLATSSILTNSARHQSAMNVLNGGTNTPQPFDFALRPEQVLSVIQPFVSGCDMDITPVKPLKLTSELHSGVAIQFDMSTLPPSSADDPLFCQMLVGGQPSGLTQPIESCSMPVDTIDGPIYFFITDNPTPLPANILTQDLENIKAGPAVAFVDGKQAVLSPLVVSHDKFASSGKKETQLDVKVVGVSHIQTPIKGNKVRRDLIEDEE